jgi:hypothetical protein
MNCHSNDERKVKMMKFKPLYSFVFLITLSVSYLFNSLTVSACNPSSCGCNGTTQVCVGGVCWFSDNNSYCDGHAFSGTWERTYYSGNYTKTLVTGDGITNPRVYEDSYEYGIVNGSQVNTGIKDPVTKQEIIETVTITDPDTEEARVRVDRVVTTYNEGGEITYKYSQPCSKCSKTLDYKSTVYKTPTKHDETSYIRTIEYQYRGLIYEYHQDESGNFQYTGCVEGNWSGWNKNKADTTTTLTWSKDSTDTHYPSDTHTDTNAYSTVIDSSINETIGYDTTRKWHRYLYRKQYYLYLFPFEETPLSTTALELQNPDGFTLADGQNYYYKKLYVGQKIFTPKTSDVFRMVGWATYDGWFSNGIKKPEGSDEIWVTGIDNSDVANYDDPTKPAYEYYLYARWYSEPGTLYLMPNSSIGTDSGYAAYIDDGDENANEQADTYLFSSKPSSSGGYTSIPTP